MQSSEGIHDHFDLAFIGAGISTAFTLRSLLASLEERPPSARRIAVIDTSSDFFSGVAYGTRSGSTARIITPLSEFLAPPELDEFVAWLRERAADSLEACVREGGNHTATWLAAHRSEIEEGRCAHLYLPRRLFGAYIGQRLTEAIDRASSRGVAVTLIEDEALGVRRVDDGFAISTGHHGQLSASDVVLAVGTPSGRRIFPGSSGSSTMLRIDTPYDPGLPEAVRQVADHLAHSAGDPPRIAIVGANATMLDLLYQFEDHPSIAAAEPVYCIVSPRGVLPPRAGHVNGRTPTLPNLDALEQQPEVSAQDVLRAVLDDLAHHGAPTEEVAWLIASVNDAIGRIIQQLDDDQKAVFANSVGTEIGRFQRRAGDDYSQVVDDLDAQRRIERVRGTFDQLMMSRSSDRVDVIINATGSAGLTPGVSPLLDSIIEGGLATPTPSNAGFVVDDDYAASPGFFVMGPLLAGNVLDGRPVWHLEHAGRIIEMGTALGDRLGQNLL